MTREDIGRVPDVIGADLCVLFCGINPDPYTAALGHHFARPGNRFWGALHESGFTPRLFAPHENGLVAGYPPAGLAEEFKKLRAAADDCL